MAKLMTVEILLVLDDDADPTQVYKDMDLNVEHKNIQQVEIINWGEDNG